MRQTIMSSITEQAASDATYYQDFNHIGNMGDFWSFLTSPFLDALWPEESLTNGFYLQSESRVVGAVRIRQQRVMSTTCDVGSVYKPLVFVSDDGNARCYETLQLGDADTGAHPTNLNLTEYNLINDGTVWKGGQELGYARGFSIHTRPYSGFVEYDGSGYVIDIPSGDRAMAEEIIIKIAESDWCDRSTRVIFLETVLFNANLNTLVFGVSAIETPPAGGAIPFRMFIPLPAERYPTSSPAERVYLALEIVFLIIALVYLLQEGVELTTGDFGSSGKKSSMISQIRKRLKTYIVSDWNSVDLINIALLGIWVWYRITNYIRSKSVSDLIEKRFSGSIDGNRYYLNLALLADRSVIEYNWVAAVMILYWIKLLKYLTLAPGVGPVVGAIVATMFSKEVMIFALVLVLVILSMTLGFFLAFGLLVPEYQSFQQTVVQVTFVALGNFDLEPLAQVSPGFGPFIMFTAALVINLVMMNIFIAVIGNVYDAKLENANSDWEDGLTERMMPSSKQLAKAKKLDGRGFVEKATSRTLELFNKYRDENEPTDRTKDALQRISRQLAELKDLPRG